MRIIICMGCGKEVKINKYKENSNYHCADCINKKHIKPKEESK